MGRSTTPKYRVEAIFFDGTRTRGAWQVRSNVGHSDGKPCDINLSRWAADLEASTQPGGANAHLQPIVVASACIVEQATSRIVAQYRGPSFVVEECM